MENISNISLDEDVQALHAAMLAGEVETVNIGTSDLEFMYFSPSTEQFYYDKGENTPEDVIEIRSEEARAILNKLDAFAELYVMEDGRPSVRQTTKITEADMRARLQTTLTNYLELEYKKPVRINGVMVPCDTETMNKFVTFLSMAQITGEESMEYLSEGSWYTLSLDIVRNTVMSIRKWQVSYQEEYRRLQKDIDAFVDSCHGQLRLMNNYNYQPNWPTSIE